MTISPDFNSEIYEYSINIQANEITKLDIEAIPNREDANIEITGNENLEIGKNIIEIKLKAEGEETITYRINVEKIDGSELGNNLFSIYLIALIIVLILCFFINFKKTK